MRVAIFLVLFFVILLQTVNSMPSLALPQFEVSQQITQIKCHAIGEKEIVSVAENILNDNDSGITGNTWALDNYTKEIFIWQHQDGSFCATMVYHGQFTTLEGKSPLGNSTISNGINGTFKGTLITTIFNATFSPKMSTNGTIGTFDYKCSGNVACTKPNLIDQFFTNSLGLDISRYVFLYHTGTHGIFQESSNGHSGDIMG